MSVYKTDGLTNFQKCHRMIFLCPEGSLSHWGVKKIEYCYRNERTKIHVIWAHVIRRTIALAMPIFNLLDALHYVPMAAYKLVQLKPKDALHDLLKCFKCLQVFLCAVPTLVVAMIEPKWFYRTEGMWLDVKNEQMKREITHAFEKMKGDGQAGAETVVHLKAACEKVIDKMVGNDRAIEILKKVLEKVISEIPTDDLEKQEIIIEQYIEMFSELLVCSAHQQVELNKMTEHFTGILELIIKVRHPLLRLSLIHLIVTTAKNNPDTYEDIAKKEYANHNRQALLYMVARLITDDGDLLARLMEISNDRNFKDRQMRTSFIATLHEIHQSELKDSDKEKALGSLLDSFDLDQRIAEAGKSVQRKKREPKNAEERDQMIEDKKRNIEQKQGEIQSGNKKVKRLESQIQNLKNEIALLEKMRFISDSEREELLKLKKDKGSHFHSAQNILRMFLSLNDKNFASKYLSQIGSKKKYPHLSDERIVTDIFKEIFDLENLPPDAFEKIQRLRAPWALVAFHGRLNEVKAKYRSDLIQCNKAIVQALLDGTYDELRHETDANPTLKKVFEVQPDLKDKWMHPSEDDYTVKGLYSKATKRFANFKIVEANDPSDILLIGNDTHTCVHLGGRIECVSGMSAFIRDGKIHTILIKDEEGVTVAETQLQLMWDEVNKKPVLFIEEANFLGGENNDYSLEHAIYSYARERAKELGLNLVSCYHMKDPKGKLISSRKYEGKVGSLGSSSPLEYVNRYFKNYSKPYDLGQTWYVTT